MKYDNDGYEVLVQEQDAAAQKMMSIIWKKPELISDHTVPEVAAFIKARDKASEYYQKWMDQNKSAHNKSLEPS